MTWTIYWLSLLDNARAAFEVAAFVSGIALIACALVAAVGVPEPIPRNSVPDFDAHDARMKASAKLAVGRLFLTLLICIGLHALLPSKRDIIEAYLMVEGSKVANVDAAGKVAAGAVDRIDKLLNALETKWTRDK